MLKHRNKKYIALGGTFESLHVGHQYMLSECIYISKYTHSTILIGLTIGNILTINRKLYKVSSSDVRRKNICLFLNKNTNKSFINITDEYGPTLNEQLNIELLIASPETINGARKIVQERKKRGYKLFPIYIVGYLKNEYGYPISSTLIKSNFMDFWGTII